jgi:hypothetical protein
MMRVKIFADYVTPNEAKLLFEKVNRATDFPDEYGADKKLFFVGDDDQPPTHALVINHARPSLTGMSKWNVVGLAQEPVKFLKLDVNYLREKVGIYYLGDPCEEVPFATGHGYLPHAVSPKDKIVKTQVMSLMISQKKFAPGHMYRHQLAAAILKTDLPVHIYGRGCKFYPPDTRLKGEFDSPDPMLNDYKFHVCIENFESDYYFSEKVIDPVCYGATPLYLGCRNIDEFFPNMTVKLTGSLDKDMALISEICQDPEKFIKPSTLDAPDQNVNLIRDILAGKVFTD